jgi:hypothetical protein
MYWGIEGTPLADTPGVIPRKRGSIHRPVPEAKWIPAVAGMTAGFRIEGATTSWFDKLTMRSTEDAVLVRTAMLLRTSS